MNFDAVETIANAVLYEGYMLYPYRPSSTKNRQRWNFGTLYPQAFAEAQRPMESSRFSAECLVSGTEETKLNLRLRFLQVETQPSADEQSAERTAELNDIRIADLLMRPMLRELRIAAEPALLARLEVGARRIGDGVFRLSFEMRNITPADASRNREALLPFSFTSAHLLLGVEAGEFISLLEPQPQYQAAVAECHNVGVFPVLVGEPGDRSMMLCSPIILYDYPQVAPESAGNFFDGTEMDEMLSLRVLTLTEEEKQEMRQADPPTRSILERTETLPAEQMMKLHGAIRGLRRVQQGEENS